MTNGTDSDSVPVADPTPGGDSDTRWPTWSDISRLHRIPSTPGEAEPSGSSRPAEDPESSAAPAAATTLTAPRRPEPPSAPTGEQPPASGSEVRDDPEALAGTAEPSPAAEPVDRGASGEAPAPDGAPADDDRAPDDAEAPHDDHASGAAGTPGDGSAPDGTLQQAETRAQDESAVTDASEGALPPATPEADDVTGDDDVADVPRGDGPDARDDGAAPAVPSDDGTVEAPHDEARALPDDTDDTDEPAAVEPAAGEPAAGEPAAVEPVATGSVAAGLTDAEPDLPRSAPATDATRTATEPEGAQPGVDDLPTAVTERLARALADLSSVADQAAPAQTTAVQTTAVQTTPVQTTPVQTAPPMVDPVRTSAFPATSEGASASLRVDGGAIPAAVREPSVLDDFEPEDGRRRWPRQLAVALGIVLVLVGAYVAASYALGHRVPRGATVAGVDIGGLTQTAAVDRLTGRLGPATTGSLTVKAGDQQSQLDPAQAGLTFDAAATVRRLVGVDLLQPVRLWDQVVGVGAQPAVTAADPTALHTAVQQLADSLQVDAVNGAIVFVDGQPHATPAQDGTDLDVAGAEKAIRDGWLVGARPLVLPTKTAAPDITQAETDAALTEVAQRVAGAPVTVSVADRSVSLPASTLAANASFAAQDGKLVLQMNGPALVTQVLAQMPGLVTAASDAHFEFQNDAPVLVPGTPGTTIDPAALATAVATAASSVDKRTATVSLVPSDPSQSTAALQALGIKEIVSEFATPLTSEPHRTVNITIGASKINGVVVKPGDTFSLGEALSPIDPAHGYIDAGAIVDGDHVQALGGGLSQVSTTTYNAAFFAGFEDVAHTPHSEWFSRYPEGREATIFYPSLDMKWKNNTPYGALIQSWVAGNQVHVRIWGTKYWTVTSTTSARSKVHAPTTVYSQSPTCTAQSAGNPGFTVTVTRQLALNGEVKQTTSRTTTYKAQDTIICGPAPTGTPSPTS